VGVERGNGRERERKEGERKENPEQGGRVLVARRGGGGSKVERGEGTKKREGGGQKV